MELTRLNPKGVMVGIKKGMTVEDFCEKYQCSVLEFTDYIESMYSRDKRQQRKILEEIKANEKKPRPKKESVVKIEKILLPPDTIDKPHSVLEELKGLEKEQSQKLMELETQRKELIRKHTDNLNTLRTVDESIKVMRKQLDFCYSKYKSFYTDCVEVQHKINDVWKQCQEAAKSLGETRLKIKDLETVTLFVYSSGEISVENKADFELVDTGAEELYGELIYKDECQELRAKDIRTLSKVMKITNNAGKKIDIVWEDPEVEKAYKALAV